MILLLSFNNELKWNSKLLDSLSDATTGVSRQCIMEIADKIITVVFWQAHERSSHHDEFYFVDAVTKLLQLNYINRNSDINSDYIY